MKMRLGLSESLEEYAGRLGVKPDEARITWRLQGLRFLFPDQLGDQPFEHLVSLVNHSGCRVAPNIPVPTKTVVIGKNIYPPIAPDEHYQQLTY